MANKNLFKSIVGQFIWPADVRNEAGGSAYRMEPKAMLAQYAVTGCLNATYYASAEAQLASVLALCKKVEPEFLAKTALFARSRGFMKDMPALLCAVLASRSPGLMAEVFVRTIDDARMLRNFVQIMRSGVTGRKSLGTLPKRLVKQWLEQRSDEQVFRASVGNDPSLADTVKMVHPRPATASRKALYGYLLGRPHDAEALPQLVREFEAFKRGGTDAVPDVPFQMLTALPLKPAHWREIARHAPWQMTRMNLNTFLRHGVFEAQELVELVAKRLQDRELIARSKVFPYQLMVAHSQVQRGMPAAIAEALQDAMETAIENVPGVRGKVYVLPDVSGSMQSPLTGYRKGATSAVRCIDVAALVAAAIVRRNPTAEVLPFSDDVVPARLNPRDSVMTNARKLAELPSGGTNCSAPLVELNRRKATGDLVVYVSDNQSWMDSPLALAGQPTETMRQWQAFRQRSPKAKMVCIDLQPYGSTQAHDREDILNIGGFSDQVFEVISLFSRGELRGEHWVEVIANVQL